MVNVSKKKVKKQVHDLIHRQFYSNISKLSNENDSKIYFESFFSVAEQQMLAKRFSIIVLLELGYSFATIQKNLKVSPTTVSAIWRRYKRGDFDLILEKLNFKPKRKTKFQKYVENLIRGGMPPIAGRGRWRNVYRLMDEKE